MPEPGSLYDRDPSWNHSSHPLSRVDKSPKYIDYFAKQSKCFGFAGMVKRTVGHNAGATLNDGIRDRRLMATSTLYPGQTTRTGLKNERQAKKHSRRSPKHSSPRILKSSLKLSGTFHLFPTTD